MARKVFIDVTDHNADGVCSLYYTVRFKLTSESVWTTLNYQQPVLSGSPPVYYLVIDNLSDDEEYNYEIIRHCCQGVNSATKSGTFETTL